jgi:hypothetical protein
LWPLAAPPASDTSRASWLLSAARRSAQLGRSIWILRSPLAPIGLEMKVLFTAFI